MDIRHRIQACERLTSTEQSLASTILANQERLSSFSIEDLARESHTSPAAVSRFCKKLGLSGFRELKIEAARTASASVSVEEVNVDYPFMADDSPRLVAQSFRSLYQLIIDDAVSCLSYSELYACARLVARARDVQLHTHSHNFYVAATFHERLLRIGHAAVLPSAEEEQRIVAAASHSDTVAIVISYSGRATFLSRVLPILRERNVPVIFIGSMEGARLNPGLAHYLLVSDQEDPQERISQFASHIALQYVLDVLYGCIFTLDYDNNVEFLQKTMRSVDDRSFDE